MAQVEQLFGGGSAVKQLAKAPRRIAASATTPVKKPRAKVLQAQK
jgi:hypothetical protein